MNNFVWSADNSLSHACPIAAPMLLSRNHIRMVKGEHIPSGSNTAETTDRTILWVIFAGNFCSVSQHSSLVQWLRRVAVLLRKFSQLSLTCLSLGSVTWHHRHLLSISSNWIHLWWGCLWLSGRFLLLLEGFWLTWGSRSCRSSAELFWWDFRRWLHYLSPLGAKHKNMSCILVDFYPLLWIFSPEKLQASAVITWDSNV